MKKTDSKKLAQLLDIHPSRSLEATLKAKLIGAIIKAAAKKGLTHSELSVRSQIPRSAVTGILSGSLQKVSIDRVLRLLEAVHLTADIRIKEAA